jgi:hypothetical protein
MSLEEWYHMIEKDGLAQVELYEDNWFWIQKGMEFLWISL